MVKCTRPVKVYLCTILHYLFEEQLYVLHVFDNSYVGNVCTNGIIIISFHIF